MNERRTSAIGMLLNDEIQDAYFVSASYAISTENGLPLGNFMSFWADASAENEDGAASAYRHRAQYMVERTFDEELPGVRNSDRIPNIDLISSWHPRHFTERLHWARSKGRLYAGSEEPDEARATFTAARELAAELLAGEHDDDVEESDGGPQDWLSYWVALSDDLASLEFDSESFDAAIAAWDAIAQHAKVIEAAESGDGRFVWKRVRADVMVAQSHAAMGETSAAMERFELASKHIDAGRAAAPDDAGLPGVNAWVLDRWSYALYEANEPAAALMRGEEALAIRDAAAAESGRQPNAIHDLVDRLWDLGDYALEANDAKKAAGLLDRAQTEVQALLECGDRYRAYHADLIIRRDDMLLIDSKGEPQDAAQSIRLAYFLVSMKRHADAHAQFELAFVDESIRENWDDHNLYTAACNAGLAELELRFASRPGHRVSVRSRPARAPCASGSEDPGARRQRAGAGYEDLMEQQVRDAIACITVRQNGEIVNRGTGFLVAPGVVLTALHVSAPDGEIVLSFPGHETTATRGRCDKDLDWAELRCAEAPSARPLRLGKTQSGANWSAYGWPDAQHLDGMVVHGSVTNQLGRIGGHPALQLFCQEAAAGQGMKLRGLSGGPVFVDGRVVGLARFALMTDGRSEGGTLYASPIADPARVLGLSVTAARTDDADLDVLLARVRHFWIEGVLDRSVTGNAVDLEMREQTDAVENPWEAVVQQPDEGSRVIPPGTTATDVFDDLQRSMLILGEPGSGKTTTLLKIARDVAARGDAPLVLHLSTWSQGSLRDWVLAEMGSKYQIPERVAGPWLEQDRLMLFLDGLDEVPAENRAACVHAINAYESMAGLVVTCRAGDYEALPTKLRVNGAVCLRPLSTEQIDRCVADAGPSLEGLAAALHHDEALRDLAKSPLMLNVMVQAYRDTPAETVEREHSVDHLFDTFVERTFKRPGQTFDRASTERGLRWIARDMQRRGRSVFLIEEMQPDTVDRTKYRVAFVCIVGVAIGALCATVLMQPHLGKPPPTWPWIRPIEVSGWLLAGPLWTLGVTLVERRRPLFKQFLLYCLLWVPIALAMLPIMAGKEQHFFACGVIALLVAAHGSTHSFADAIRPAEALGVSWPRARRWAMWGLVAGAAHTVVGLLRLWPDWIAATGFIPGGALVGGILGAPEPRVVRGKTSPNEGMRLTWRTARRMAILSVLPAAIVPIALLLGGKADYLVPSCISFGGAVTGMLVLWFGGLDLIKHYIVRTLVALPFNLPRFLENAYRLGFLQRVGSGYIFTHRLLRDHFAERGAGPDEPRPSE